MNQTPERLDFLDSLRGLAALSVVWSHYILGYGLPSQSPWLKNALIFSPLHIWWDGFAAVSFFFVLSGFVLALKHFPKADLRLGAYAFSRVSRIWLPYFAAFVWCLLLKDVVFTSYATSLAPSDWIAKFWQGKMAGTELWREAVLLGTLGKFKIMPQAWSLTIELMLSLFIPFMALFAARNILFLFAIAAAAILFRQAPIFLFHFALGVAIAKCYRTKHWRMGGPARMLLWLVGIVLYTIRFTVPVYFKNSIAEDHVWYFTGTGAAMILLAVLQSEIAREILRHRVLIFLGRISYSTYLFHFSVLLTITPATLFMLNRFGVNSPLACWTVGILATTVATIAVATVAHGFIEVPSIRLGKIFSRSARAPSFPAGKGST